MGNLFSRLASWSIRHRGVVLALLSGVTALALVGHIDPRLLTARWAADPTEQDAEGDASATDQAAPPPNVQPISLANSDAVLVVEAKDFFTPRAAAAMRQVVAQLETLPQVRSVLWLDRVPMLNIFGLPEPLLPKSSASPSRFAAAREQARRHPLVGGQLLSDDGQTQLLLIGFDHYQLLEDRDATEALRETAAEAAQEFPDVGLRFRVTGRVPSMIAAIARHEANQLKYQLLGYGMIFFMALILFRGLRAVIIVSLAPIAGVFWTTGIIQFFDYDNPLVDVILPILVSLVGLTDGVHLMVQIRKLRAAGASQRSAAEQGLQQVGLACFLTSLTTAVGFGSLMLADSRWVQQFGLCSTLGVGLCFLAVVTLIPLACSSWLGSQVHVGYQHSLIDRHLERIGGVLHFVLRYRVPVAALGIACTIVLLLIGARLRPDQRQTDGLPLRAEATQAMLHVDRAFGGIEFSQVALRWSAEVASDGPEVLRVVQRVDELLRTEPLIGHPLSIRNLLEAQPGSGPAEERMSLLELLPPPLKRAFYVPEERRATVSFRVRDLGIAQYGPVFQRITDALQEIEAEHPQFELELTGGAVRRWKNLYQIVVDLAASLGSAAVIILVILALVYRSLRMGLISIVPNLFPLAFTATYLVLSGHNLEVVMVCNFTVCLGIAVDDTIHFLTRFREERPHCGSDDEAIRRAFTGVGTALIMTTAVLVAGFAIVTFSDSRDHRIFATMGALTIAAALFCDLVFLPALLSLFASPKRKA
ncbi:MAG: MMPL family transporter [Planctomycetales bacterium]|nr:MMPL family transporter [Planctomycetales bacterium]